MVMLIGYWYPPALETGGICQRTPQVHPCWQNLCRIPSIPKTSAKAPPKGKTFETINSYFQE